MHTEGMTRIGMITEIRERFAQVVRRAADAAAALLSTRLRFRSHEAPCESSRAVADLARSSGTSERFVEDWLVAEAADAYIIFDPRTGRYANLRRGTGNS